MRSDGRPATGQEQLVAALRAPGGLAPDGARLIETHISWVLLTGTEVYKIKKAVRLPFLDFGTLAARRVFCERELALNRRFAPAIYLDVVAITGTPEAPEIEGDGPTIEYAVRMREFAQDALFSSLLERDALTPALIDALALRIAAAHAAASPAPAASGYGDPRRIRELALANFAEMSPLIPASDRAVLAALEAWTRREFDARADDFARRQANAAIRECHGDLHLANIVVLEGEPTLFDGIEFNDDMRWIDTMAEIAFPVMDLEYHGHPALAHRLLSAYLGHTGDYAGCAVLRFYLVYRAMVRAKVACLRAQQQRDGSDEHAASLRAYRACLDLATAYVEVGPRALLAMHGPSGCGKSWLALRLVECLGAVRIRMDVERKRLAGLAAGADSGSSLATGLYTADMSRRAYEHALTCAEAVVEGGFIALVDAAFLMSWQRRLARDRAHELTARFTLVDCVASVATLRERITARSQAGDDPSEADLSVLAHQLENAESLSPAEIDDAVVCNTESAQVAMDACAAIATRLGIRSTQPAVQRAGRWRA